MQQMPEMMRCERQAMTLTVPGCVRLWRSAQEREPKEHEGRYKCLTCPIGAANAGAHLPTTAEATHSLRTICPRCERGTERMIGNRICVSCYNREREFIAGKNAKGGRPQIVLLPASLIRVDANGCGPYRSGLVIGTGEAIVSQARIAQGPVGFTLPAVRLTSPQRPLLVLPSLVARARPAWQKPPPRRLPWNQLDLGIAA